MEPAPLVNILGQERWETLGGITAIPGAQVPMEEEDDDEESSGTENGTEEVVALVVVGLVIFGVTYWLWKR